MGKYKDLCPVSPLIVSPQSDLSQTSDLSQLKIENKELKRSNEELRTNMHMLMTQNQQLLEHLRKEEPKITTNAVIKPTGMKRKMIPEFYTDHTYSVRVEKIEPEFEEIVTTSSTELVTLDGEDDVVIVGANHIVIKKEEETDTAKHALLGISLPQKLQILLVSLITMWLTNPRFESHLLHWCCTKRLQWNHGCGCGRGWSRC